MPQKAKLLTYDNIDEILNQKAFSLDNGELSNLHNWLQTHLAVALQNFLQKRIYG